MLTGVVAIKRPDDEIRHLSSAQAQVAFARLTMERSTGTSRDQLADTVWPDGLPDTWASALRSVVSRVRGFVADGDAPAAPTVVSQAGRYVLRLPPDASVDVESAEASIGEASRAYANGNFIEARRLGIAAVTCLRRSFLPDHEGEWVNSVRQHLDELLVGALETTSRAAASLGEDREALRYADEAVARAPLRESAHRCRMAAHVTAGNRAEALRAYDRLRRMLAEELGVDPAPESQAFYLELLAAPAEVTTAPRQQLRAKPGATAPFAGRRHELSVLADCWTQAETGDSHLVLVTGEPGIGKTRLAIAAASQVGLDRGLVLHSRCDQAAEQPYQPFVEALTGYLTVTPPDMIPDLGPAAGHTLSVLARGELPGRSRDDQLAVLTNLVTSLARAAPIFLVLDDLDVAGEETIALLRQVLRQRRGTTLLVVATAADPVQHPPTFAAMVRSMDREGYLVRMSLAGLEEPDVAILTQQLVATRSAGGIPSPRQLLADTAGNPHLLLNVLRWHCEHDAQEVAARHELPPWIQEYAADRLASLPPAPVRLLTAAALAGSTFELDLASRAAELSLPESMDALDILLAAGLVRPASDSGPDKGEYRFRHGLLRRAIREGCHGDRRRALHRRWIDAIESQRPARLERYSEDLARHYGPVAAEANDSNAVRWGWAAGARAVSDGALNEAVRLYRTALAHVPADEQGLRGEALTNLGLAQFAAGHPDAEQSLFDGALQALHSGRPEIAARAAIGLADAVAERSRLRSEAIALVEALLRRPAQRGTIGSSPHALGSGQPARPLDDLTMGQLLARHRRLGGRISTGPTSQAATTALMCELRRLEGPAELPKRFALALDLSEIAEATGDQRARLTAAHHRASVAELTDQRAERDQALAILSSAADHSGNERGPTVDALLTDHVVALAITEGRFSDAVATAQLAGSFTTESTLDITPTPGGLASRQLQVVGWLRATAWPPTATPPHTLTELSLAALAAGERGQSHLTLRALATGADELPTGDEWLHAVGVLALGATELGDASTAQAVHTLLAPYADLVCGVGYRSFVAPASFHLGRLSLVLGDWAAAERHLTAALATLSRRRARPWAALAQLSLAQAMRARGRAGDQSWARALANEARETLDSVGICPSHGLVAGQPTPAHHQLDN
ncbi:ATP-binding protein [Natronosporangium hydrolyticum]|nr:BTAD domain-containing putative transcriptional regulator [Natronosporangium hydrolyticum]